MKQTKDIEKDSRYIFLMMIFPLMVACTASPRLASYLISPANDQASSASIVISPDQGREDAFCFKLKNNTDESLLIDWENSYLIINDTVYRCIHTGIWFVEREVLQEKSEVQSGSEIADCLFPSEKIYPKVNSKRWIQEPLGDDHGKYVITIIQGCREEQLRGTFLVELKRQRTPVVLEERTTNTYDKAKAWANGLWLVSQFLLLFSY